MVERLTGKSASRRVGIAACSFLLAMLVVCSPLAPAAAQGVNESPMSAAQVAAGALPPLRNRLPVDPLIVKPLDRIGQYGGEWRIGVLGYGDGTGLLRMVGYDGMVTWSPDWRVTTPNLVRSVEVLEQGRGFLFRLREGLRWSDGSHFTAEDIAFGLLDMTLNRALQPAAPAWYREGGVDPVITMIDPLTLKIEFQHPFPLFLDHLATPEGVEFGSYQKRYCSQFLPRHNPEAAAMAAAQGFASWREMATTRCGRSRRASRWSNPDRPTLDAWMVEKPYVEGAKEIVLVRNPYYWKVDEAGNQLPYLDRVVAKIGANVNALTLLALRGELDMQDRHISNRQTRLLLEPERARAGFRFYELASTYANSTVLAFNFHNRDERLRRIFTDRNFRIGLSHAINREAIVKVVFQGRTIPAQVGPLPGSPLHDPELSFQHLDHDRAKARDYFRKVPDLRVDDGGKVSLSDGSPFRFRADFIAEVLPEWGHVMDMVKLDLAGVGIDMRLNSVSRNEFTRLYESNDFDMQVWLGDGGWDAILSPRWYFPSDGESRWARKWAIWWADPSNPAAELPPASVRRQMDVYRELTRAPDPQRRAELMRRILRMAAEEFSVIGISSAEDSFGVVRDDFFNVMPRMPFAWTYPNPGPNRPEQFFSTRTP